MQETTPLSAQSTTDPTEAAWAAVWTADALLDSLVDFFETPNPVTAQWLRRRITATTAAVDAAKLALGVTYPCRRDRFTLTALGEAALVAAEAREQAPERQPVA
jgi:hypothetical protein